MKPVVSPPPPLVFGPLARTDLVRYQGASGDFYPIHHDEPFALAAGFPAPISLGMLHAGLLASWATGWLGAANVRSFRVRFAEQAFPGDTLHCDGQIVREYQHEDERRVDLELFCRKQENILVVRGYATFVVRQGEIGD